MSWTNQVSTIGPFLEEFSDEGHNGSFFTFGEVVRVYIEDNVLEEILKFDPFVIYEVSQQFSQDFGFKNHLLDDVDY